MLSKTPNPEEATHSDPSRMALPDTGPPEMTTPPAATSASAEDMSKKIRKPYTITKSRESWTEPEHDKFLEALQLFDRDWKKIEAFIGSKTVIQIRSHAQKYFLKAQKTGIGEHLPPPRPKRKASHPYPQKASKAVVASQQSAPFQASSIHPEPGYVAPPDSSSMDMNAMTPGSTVGASKQARANHCCVSNQSSKKLKSNGLTAEPGSNSLSLRVLPDFTQVYSFIGSVFDPNAAGHLQKLEDMDRIDVETVLLLMRNLSINLTSPDFEDHRILLSSYEIETETMNAKPTL